MSFAWYRYEVQEMRLAVQSCGPAALVLMDTNYDGNKMRAIRLGLESGVDVNIYKDPDNSSDLMDICRQCLEKNLDVTKVMSNKNLGQIQKIRLLESLLAGNDIGGIADLKLPGSAIAEIKLGNEQGIDLLPYAKLRYSGTQLEQIRLGLVGKLDISSYAKKKFNADQMNEIRLGIISGVDTSKYLDPEIDARMMKIYRSCSELEIDMGTIDLYSKSGTLIGQLNDSFKEKMLKNAASGLVTDPILVARYYDRLKDRFWEPPYRKAAWGLVRSRRFPDIFEKFLEDIKSHLRWDFSNMVDIEDPPEELVSYALLKSDGAAAKFIKK